MLFFSALALAKSPALFPVGENSYVAGDIEFIKKLLMAILTGVVGLIISRFFKRQDSSEVKMDEVIKIVTKLESSVTYLERVTVKREDLSSLIREEMRYREVRER